MKATEEKRPDKSFYYFFNYETGHVSEKTCIDWLSYDVCSLKEAIAFIHELKLDSVKESLPEYYYEYLVEQTGVPFGDDSYPMSIKEFVEQIFQLIPKIPDNLIQAYKHVYNKELSYTEDSPVYKFYNRWIQYDWTQEEAVHLLIGSTPDYDTIEQEILHNAKYGYYSYNDSIEQQEIEAIIFGKDYTAYSHIDRILGESILRKEIEIDKLSGKIISNKTSILDWSLKRGIKLHPLFHKLLSNYSTETERIRNTALDKEIQPFSNPLIDLMHKAIKELDITNDSYPDKESLKEWFRSNWVHAYIKYSDNLAERMVTMVRPPNASKGGNSLSLKRIA